jgi:hypothetical protein
MQTLFARRPIPRRRGLQTSTRRRCPPLFRWAGVFAAELALIGGKKLYLCD